jgi:hypothetical protein
MYPLHLPAAEMLALDGFADGEIARGMLAGTTQTAIAREGRLGSVTGGAGAGTGFGLLRSRLVIIYRLCVCTI